MTKKKSRFSWVRSRRTIIEEDVLVTRDASEL